MTAKPAQFGIKKVKIVFTHSEGFTIFATENYVLFGQACRHNSFVILDRQWVLEAINFTVVFDVDLKQNMAISLRSTSLNRQQRTGKMKVKIGRYFFWVKPAQIRLFFACADDG